MWSSGGELALWLCVGPTSNRIPTRPKMLFHSIKESKTLSGTMLKRESRSEKMPALERLSGTCFLASLLIHSTIFDHNKKRPLCLAEPWFIINYKNLEAQLLGYCCTNTSWRDLNRISNLLKMTKPTWYWVYSNLGELGFSIETELVEQIYICMCVLRKSHRYSYICIYS